MQSILIAGCGYVGEALGQLLVREGKTVWGLRRDPSQLPEGIRPVAANLNDRASLSALPRDVDAIVYAVGADDSSEQAYRVAYIDALIHLLDEFRTREQKISNLVFVSSTAVYGQAQGEWVDEASATEPNHFSGKILLEAENLALRSGYPSTIARFGGIYGPRRTSLIDKVALGQAKVPTTSTFTNRIHRDDCAQVLRHLLTVHPRESIYLGVDHEPADLMEVMKWIASKLGVAEPQIESQPNQESRRGRSSKRCSNRRLIESGYRFLYPTFREGYESLMRLQTT